MEQNTIGNKERWQTYEANVQVYRSNFISSQSFFLAVGAILLGKSPVWIILLLALVAAINIWYIWFRIIISRIRIVDYYKFGIGERFALSVNKSSQRVVLLSDNPNIKNYRQIREKDYVVSRKLRKEINKIMSDNEELRKLWSDSANQGRFHNIRMTRMKIDVLIPILFSLIWIGFIADSIWQLVIC